MKLAKLLMSHALQGTITFLAVVFATGSFFWFESTWMKLAGCLGALVKEADWTIMHFQYMP